MSVRRLGSAVFPVGLLLWLVALLANVVMRVAGITDYPWHVVLFPLWGPPAFMLAWRVARTVMAMLVLLMSVVTP